MQWAYITLRGTMHLPFPVLLPKGAVVGWLYVCINDIIKIGLLAMNLFCMNTIVYKKVITLIQEVSYLII